MRKLSTAIISLTLILAACGDDDTSSSETSTVRNAALPTVALSGRTVDATTLKPLKGLRVTGFSYLTRTRTYAVTDEYGKFSMAVTGDEFGLQIAPTSTYCGGVVKILPEIQNSLNAIATSRAESNTFIAGDKGTIGVFKNGSPSCP